MHESDREVITTHDEFTCSKYSLINKGAWAMGEMNNTFYISEIIMLKLKRMTDKEMDRLISGLQIGIDFAVSHLKALNEQSLRTNVRNSNSYM